jgi:hypothetical protein
MHKTWILAETDKGERTFALLMFEFKKCESALFYYYKFIYDNKVHESFDIFYLDILRIKFWDAVNWILGKLGIK